MDLKGKKVAFLGDSITEGCAASSAEKIYHQVIKADLGLGSALNYGVGGTRIAPQHDKDSDMYPENFIIRADKLPADADYVFVFGGTNDYGHGDAPVGTLLDNGTDTFCGAVKTLLAKLVNRYGKDKIVVMTPLHRRNDKSPSGEGTRKNGAPLKIFVDIIKEIAEKAGLRVIDLFGESALDPNDDEINAKCFADGLHPNDAGHNLLAKTIEKATANM